MCLFPTLIPNPKYKATKKNGGVIPPISDERVKLVPIGCQQCIECRKQKARSWQIRLLQDIRQNTNGKFVTLTFSNQSIATLTKEVNKKLVIGESGELQEAQLEGYELDNEICTYAVRHFCERWRKKHKKSIRHWLVTELGHQGTENIHIHGILWTNDLEEVEKIWQYGHVWKGHKINGKIQNYVNDVTTGYITKYIFKTDIKHKHYKSIILTSPGIGSNYTKTYQFQINEYNGDKTDTTYRTTTGHKVALPIYFRNKRYTEKERENLWLIMLDKNERYVCGEKIDISETLDDYYGALEHYRKINGKLGYGTGEKDWSREQYERERRIIMQKKRMIDGERKLQKKRARLEALRKQHMGG